MIVGDPTSAPGLPGMSPGAKAPESVASKPAALAAPGSDRPLDRLPGKHLADTPEAVRKRAERAARRAQQPPPPLQPVPPGPATGASPVPQGPAGVVPGPAVDPAFGWCPEDFHGCAPEIVELAEAWRVDMHTKRAAEGGLPGAVVAEIAKDAAFPASSKKSLSRTSPDALAKLFNLLSVPLKIRPLISSAPALAYIVLRDFQTGARINELIARNNEEKDQAPKPAKEK